MKKFLKKFLQVLVCIIMIPILLIVNVILHMVINMGISTLASKKVSDFTVNEHEDRLRERLDRRIPKWEEYYDFNVDEYEIFPLYDLQDNLVYFLVEFNPIGFLIIRLRNEYGTELSMIPGSMYSPSEIVFNWSPYTINEEKDEIYHYKDGKIISYNKSPFFVHGTLNEKKYLLLVDGNAIMCVKQNGIYINQVNGEVIGDYFTLDDLKTQPYVNFHYFDKIATRKLY